MNRLVDFEIEHIKQMNMRDLDERMLKMAGDWEEKLRNTMALGRTMTGMKDDIILGCGGILPLWEGVAEGWLLTADEIEQYPLAFHKLVRQFIAEAEDALDLHRIQIYVWSEFNKSIRWVKSLGFENEGLMRAFTTDKLDFYRMAKVRL